MRIEVVATDLSAAYISAVRKNAPEAVYIFDHFHVVKLINEALDKVRKRIIWHEREKERMEADENRKLGKTTGKTRADSAPSDTVGISCGSRVVKGTTYIILRNRDYLTEQKDIDRLNAALALNHDLSAAYYLKEEDKLVWDCDSKEQARSQLDSWLSSANAPPSLNSSSWPKP